jgi:hypothetical protein
LTVKFFRKKKKSSAKTGKTTKEKTNYTYLTPCANKLTILAKFNTVAFHGIDLRVRMDLLCNLVLKIEKMVFQFSKMCTQGYLLI